MFETDEKDIKNTEGTDDEISAEYSSLSDVDDDVSDEAAVELLKAFEDLENQMSDAGTYTGLGSGDDELDEVNETELDAMIRALMEQESEAEPWVPLEELDAAIDAEEEIYEGENAGKEIDLSVLYADEEEDAKFSLRGTRKWAVQKFKKGDKITKILISAIMGMSLLTFVALGFFISVLFSGGNRLQEAQAFTVTRPSYAFNNASHSFVNLSAVVGQETVTLQRLLLDDMVTVFYFAGELDLGRFVFHLEDFNGKIYQRDLIFAENTTRNALRDQTQIRFAPLDPLAAGFRLSVTDLETGITTEIPLTFDDDAIAFARHLTEPVEIETGIEGINITIDHATFSAFSSSLNFSLKNHDANKNLVFGAGGATSPISLRHTGFSVPAVDNELHLSYFGGGTTLAAMDFNPLRSLMGRVDVSFGHIYMQYHIRQTFDAAPMMTAGDDRARTIDLGDHIINIAGIARQGNYFIMPLHGLMRVQYEDEYGEITESYERMPTTVDAILIGRDTNGRILRLPGRVVYDARGTDVVFDVSENEDWANIRRDSISVEINSASVRMPQISASIELGELGFMSDNSQDAIAADIEAYFAANSVGWISAPGGSRYVEYRAQVRQIHVEGNEVYARVVERLAYVEGGRLHEITQSHRVVARLGAGGVSITRRTLE